MVGGWVGGTYRPSACVPAVHHVLTHVLQEEVGGFLHTGLLAPYHEGERARWRAEWVGGWVRWGKKKEDL